MIKDFHNALAIVQNGGMVRDEGWWKRIERRSPDSHFAVYFQDNNIGAIFVIRFKMGYLLSKILL